MEEILYIYLFVSFITIIPLSYAADNRKVNLVGAAIVSLLFSPIIGFLFVLCHPYKSVIDYQQRMLRMMNDMPEKLKKEND